MATIPSFATPATNTKPTPNSLTSNPLDNPNAIGPNVPAPAPTAKPYDPANPSAFAGQGLGGFSTGSTPQTTPPVPTTQEQSNTLSQAQKNVTPGATPTPQTFFEQAQSFFQPVLDQINQSTIAAENAARQQAAQTSTQQTSAMNFGMNQRGLAGSSEGNAGAAQIENQRGATVSAAVAQAEKAKADAIQNLYSTMSSQASSDFQNALARNDAQSANYIATTKAKTQQSIKSLGATGHSLDNLQQTDPSAYQAALQAYDGDVNTMKADWIAGASGISLDGGKPIQAGTNLIYTFKDPSTGKVFTQNIDTGIPLSADWAVAKSADGAIIQYNKETGQAKQLTSGDPYYQANKGATLASKQAMLVSRYGTAVNNITKQLYPTPTSNPFNLYSNSLNYTTKLDTAYKQSSEPSNTNRGASDLELADAAIKINNGGQQITEAQFRAFNDSLGMMGAAKLGWDKFTQGNLLLTQGQRDAIHRLAKENISAQKENTLNAAKVVAERATRAGVPSNMLNTPEDIISLSAASNPQADSQQGGAVMELQSNGATDNGDGTWTTSDGQIVDPNQ